MQPLRQRIRAAVQVLVRGAGFSSLGGSEGQVDVKLRKPYSESVWLYAAIRHIARPCGSVGLQHAAEQRRRRGPRPSPLDDSRLDAFWSQPARGLGSWQEFIQASIGWRKLAGECFWILGDDAVMPFPEVAESFPQLILARPDRMRHVVRGGQLVAWSYTDGDGKAHTLLPEQVIHLKQWNPYDDWRGLGEWEAARLAAETDRASATFARNLAASQGDQGVYVIGKSGVIEEAQRRQIEETLREKRRLQREGIFRPAFLTGDITVEDPKIRVVDAAFQDGRRMSAAEVFVALGVPPSMAKEQASYSIGSASDYFRLILDTCMPEGAEIMSGVSRVSTMHLGRPVYSELRWDEHPVMQEVRKERMTVVNDLWAKGMPMARIAEYLDLDLPRFDSDEMGWLPIAVVPASMAATPSLEPGPEGTGDAEPEASPTPMPDPAEDEGGPVQEAIRALAARRPAAGRASAGAVSWAAHMRRRAPIVRAYESAFTRALMEARRQVLQKLSGARKRLQDDFGGVDTHAGACDASCANGSERQAIPMTRSGAADFMFDREEFERGVKVSFRKVSERALNDGGRQVYEELGRDDPFTYPPARAQQFFRDRENKLSGVAEEVWDDIRETLQEGIDAGDSTDDLAKRVRAAFNEASAGRARRIAMTEAAAAYGVARQEGMNQAGVRYKRWLNSGGDNVRPAHMEANNQTVAADARFDVGGEQLMHPADPSGSPGNVINCHCVAVAVSDPDEGLNP